MTGLVAAAHEDERARERLRLWRVTDRATFAELRRRGRRGRSGPLSLTWLAPDPAAAPTPPRVAFAVGKASGGAVRRNRIRRRLRAALLELGRSGRLPSGTYLLSARSEAAEMPWSELVGHVDAAIRSSQAGQL